MALCARCGQQTERAAEFCSGCGTYLGSGGTDRPRTAAAGSGSTGYLRPFASRVPSSTVLHPDDERRGWGEPDSGPQQWDGQSGAPPDLPRRLADYAGDARIGAHGPESGDPLTDERLDAVRQSGGGYSLVPRGPFEPARPAYPQDGYPDGSGYPPDSPPAGYPVADTPPAGYPAADTPPAGYSATDSPVAGFPEAGDPGAGWLPPRFGPGDDPLTARVPPEYPAGSGQYAPGPEIPAQRQADTPEAVLAPYDLLAGRPAGYGPPAYPDAPEGSAETPSRPHAGLPGGTDQLSADRYPAASHTPVPAPDTESSRSGHGAPGLPFPATDSADRDAAAVPGDALRSSRWITIAATAIVLIICAATAVILLLHGRPPAHTGKTGVRHRPTATAAQSPTIRKPITVVPAAASGPDAPAVVTFLTQYFSAINHHDFAAYRQLFSTSLRGGLSRSAFTAGYGSSRDSQVTLHAIAAPAAGQLTAMVTFTSHQQPAASPNHSACTGWSIALYLRQESGNLVLVSPPAGYQATFRNC